MVWGGLSGRDPKKFSPLWPPLHIIVELSKRPIGTHICTHISNTVSKIFQVESGITTTPET